MPSRIALASLPAAPYSGWIRFCSSASVIASQSSAAWPVTGGES